MYPWKLKKKLFTSRLKKRGHLWSIYTNTSLLSCSLIQITNQTIKLQQHAFRHVKTTQWSLNRALEWQRKMIIETLEAAWLLVPGWKFLIFWDFCHTTISRVTIQIPNWYQRSESNGQTATKVCRRAPSTQNTSKSRWATAAEEDTSCHFY